jgi:hypothetical protein
MMPGGGPGLLGGDRAARHPGEPLDVGRVAEMTPVGVLAAGQAGHRLRAR